MFIEFVLEGLGGAGEGVGIRNAALRIGDHRLAPVGGLYVLQSYIICEKPHWLLAPFHSHTVNLRVERVVP